MFLCSFDKYLNTLS